MKPVVEQLEKEHGVTVDKYEVWENEEHAEMMKKHDNGMCGGVPFFVNTETKETICGSTDLESLKKWAGVS